MANENDRFALRIDDHLGGGDIAFEGNRRILDDSDRVVVLQKVVNALPARAVYETAVDENQGRAASIRGSSCLRHLSTFLPLSPRDKTAFRLNDIGYEPCVYDTNGSFLYGTGRSYKRACSSSFLDEFFSETQLTLRAKRVVRQ